MERIRQAMELALEQHWASHAPGAADVVVAEAATSDFAAPKTTLGGRRARQGRARTLPHVAEELRVNRVAVAEATFAGSRLIAALENHVHREAYCLLQGAIAERITREDLRIIGVTGTTSGRGKTLTATNLAICMARDSHATVLLDLALAGASVAGLFGLGGAQGVESCLFGGASLHDTLVCPAIDGLAILPASGGSRSVAQVLRSPQLRALLAELRDREPRTTVIVDLPAIRGRDDAEAFGSLVDGLLLVVEDGVTRESDYRRVLANIDRRKLLGTVLNCVPAD
jgi:Mrp family chromosome partitioning ATPase